MNPAKIKNHMQVSEAASVGAKIILSTCADIRRGERVLVASDPPNADRSKIISLESLKLGSKVTAKNISGRVLREPPEDIAISMLETDVTIFCVNEQRTLLWGHSDAKVAATKKGSRVLFLTQDLESTPDSIEIKNMEARSHRLGEILEKVSEVSILTGSDSKLDLQLGKRKSLRLSGIISRPGSWGAVPDYSEAAVAPLENKSKGKFSVDGIIVGLGKVDSPVELRFESGRLMKISGGTIAHDFEKLLYMHDASARILCELGFGTNHLRKHIKEEFDDKKALGTVHIALGDNHTFGGVNKSDLHIDCLATRPEVYFDGKKIDLMSI